MSIEFPITVKALLTVLGVATLASVVTLWLKKYLADWRYTTLLVLGLGEVAAIVAQFIVTQWRPSSAALYEALLIGFFGASLAVFGYEGISNGLGLLGIGKRAMASNQQRSVKR